MHDSQARKLCIELSIISIDQKVNQLIYMQDGVSFQVFPFV